MMKQIIVILLLSYTTINGQASFVVAGQSTSDVGGSVSFSLGQTFYQLSRDGPNSDAYLIEGVQQPFIVSIETLDEDDPQIEKVPNLENNFARNNDASNLEFSVFPNPFTNQVTISLEEFSEDVVFLISDAQGRLVAQESILNQQTNLDLSALNDGLYYLAVFKENSPLKTFKLIKQSN